MTDEDPFEKAARREQEIKQRLRLRAKRDDNALHDGRLMFLVVWGAVLFAHYWFFGHGALFFAHACTYGLFVVMLLAPMLILQAVWAPFLIAQYHYFGWNTLLKVHLFAFAVCALPFLFISIPSRDDKEALTV